MEGHDFVTVQKGVTVFGLCWLWTCAASDALIISLLCSIAVWIVRQQLRSLSALLSQTTQKAGSGALPTSVRGSM